MKIQGQTSAHFEPLAGPEAPPEHFYLSVLEKIACGQHDPAQRLTETRLAVPLGMSRTPVREALVRPRRKGLLDCTPQGSAMASLTRADLEEIMAVRDFGDPCVAARAAEKAHAAGVVRQRAALAADEAAVAQRSGQSLVMVNPDFRVTRFALAGKSRLTQTACRYDTQLRMLRRATLERRVNRETAVRHHCRLIEAVARGDTHGPENAIRELITHASDSIQALADVRCYVKVA